MRPRAYPCRRSAASVTPSRRTPRLAEISSCVITSSEAFSLSRFKSNQRHSCWSSEWPVAHGGLRHLRDEGLGVAEHEVHGRAAEVELFPHQPGIEPKALAGALQHGAAGGGATTHEDRDTDQPLSAHDGDLACRAVFRDEQLGHDGAGRKEHVSRRVACDVQHLAQRHVQPLQLRLPPQQHIRGPEGRCSTNLIGCRRSTSARANGYVYGINLRSEGICRGRRAQRAPFRGSVD